MDMHEKGFFKTVDSTLRDEKTDLVYLGVDCQGNGNGLGVLGSDTESGNGIEDAGIIKGDIVVTIPGGGYLIG